MSVVLVCRAAFEANKTPSEAAEELCEHSIKLGSSDNVTIVITRFIHTSTSLAAAARAAGAAGGSGVGGRGPAER